MTAWDWLMRNKSEVCKVCKESVFPEKIWNWDKNNNRRGEIICSRLEITLQSPIFREQEQGWKSSAGRKYCPSPSEVAKEDCRCKGTLEGRTGNFRVQWAIAQWSFCLQEWWPKSESLPSFTVENFQNFYPVRIGYEWLWIRSWYVSSPFSLSKFRIILHCSLLAGSGAWIFIHQTLSHKE